VAIFFRYGPRVARRQEEQSTRSEEIADPTELGDRVEDVLDYFDHRDHVERAGMRGQRVVGQPRDGDARRPLG